MVAEFEADLIRLRTREGTLVHSGEYSTLEVAELFGWAAPRSTAPSNRNASRRRPTWHKRRRDGDSPRVGVPHATAWGDADANRFVEHRKHPLRARPTGTRGPARTQAQVGRRLAAPAPRRPRGPVQPSSASRPDRGRPIPPVDAPVLVVERRLGMPPPPVDTDVLDSTVGVDAEGRGARVISDGGLPVRLSGPAARGEGRGDEQDDGAHAAGSSGHDSLTQIARFRFPRRWRRTHPHA